MALVQRVDGVCASLPLLLLGTVLLIGFTCWLLSFSDGAAADTGDRELATFHDDRPPGGHAPDCMLSAYDTCSGWIWVYGDDAGAVWGVVLDPMTCPGGCPTGGTIAGVYLYSRCAGPSGAIGGIRVETVDSQNCLVDLLYRSGPVTITHCVSGDRWTVIPVPLVPVLGHPFALTVEWGPDANLRLATDYALANYYCAMGLIGFPGCADAGRTCSGWHNLPVATCIYLTDLDGNGTLEDLCALYGCPYGLCGPSGPYYHCYPYNLILAVGLICSGPGTVEPGSWGRVKALFD